MLFTVQCLLTLLDSPLNKAGRLKVYVHTRKNVLIEINPRTRIPRTFKRYSGLMGKSNKKDLPRKSLVLIPSWLCLVQLLHKMSIRATDGREKLLEVIKNPATDHFPAGCRKIGLSAHAEKTVSIDDFVANKYVV